MVAVDPVRRIGQYEIVSHLKSGGMAALYLARRTGAAGFSRHVAIKVVHPHLAQNPGFVQMFLDEAHLSARIQHPNVVHVEELGDDHGMYFLVMEYVHGCALSQLLRALAVMSRRLTPELATWIAIQMADGLHAAHETRNEQGELMHVVHRDVSPQNVLLSYAGHVKIIDFGIAKARSRAKETTTKSLKGKLRYMAPEQAFGKPVDRRSDIYAVGIVLWEMLTVRRLFDADDDFALLDLVRAPQLTPPSKFADGISPALDAAVLRALAPHAADRPQTMQELRRMLAEALPGAASLDAAHLGELLSVVMASDIEEKKQMVPESMSGIQPISQITKPAKLSAPAAEEVLRTMTWRAANASLGLHDDDDGSAGPGGQMVPNPLYNSAPVIQTGHPSVTERIPQPETRRSPVALVLGVGLVVVLAVLGVGLFVMHRNQTQQEIESRPLATVPMPTTPVQLPPALPPAPLVPLGPQENVIDDTTPPSTDVAPEAWVTPEDDSVPTPAPQAPPRTHHHHADAHDAPPPTAPTAPSNPSMATTRHGVIPIAHDEDFEN